MIAYTAGEQHGSPTITEERYVADQAVEATVVIAVATRAEAVANIAVFWLAAGGPAGLLSPQIVSRQAT